MFSRPTLIISNLPSHQKLFIVSELARENCRKEASCPRVFSLEFGKCLLRKYFKVQLCSLLSVNKDYYLFISLDLKNYMADYGNSTVSRSTLIIELSVIILSKTPFDTRPHVSMWGASN